MPSMPFLAALSVAATLAGACAPSAPATPADADGPSTLELLAEELDGVRWSDLRIEGLPFVPSHGLARPAYNPSARVMTAIYRTLTARDPTAYRTVALLYLARAAPGDAQRALEILALEQEGPRRWNLEAAAHMHIGEWPEALEKLERAKEVDPADEITLFNRAVVLSALPLPEAARAAWDDFFAVARPSPWLDEAHERRERLDYPMAEEVDLGEDRRRLKEAILATHDRASLDALVAEPENRALLELLLERGDTFLNEGILHRRANDAGEWESLAAEGVRLGLAIRGAIAGEEVVAELEALGGSSDPLVSVGALRALAYLYIVRGDAPAARRWLHRVLAACERHGCQEEAVLAASDLGTVEAGRGDFLAAERAIREAIERLPEGFAFRRAELHNKQAYLALRIGEEGEGLRHATDAAWMHLRGGRWDGLAGSLINATATLQRRGLHRAAIRLADEAVDLARRAEVLQLEVDAMRARGVSRAALGEGAMGRLDLERAAGRAVEAKLFRQLAVVQHALAKHALAEGALDEALAHAVAARRHAQQVETKNVEEGALRIVGMADAKKGEFASALGYLRSAVEVHESIVARSLPLSARLATEKRAVELYGLIARIHSLRDRHDEAWRLLGAGEPRALEPGECVAVVGLTGDDRYGLWFRTASGSHFEERDDLAPENLGRLYGAERCPSSTTRLTVVENRFTTKGLVGAWSSRERPEVPVIIARSVAQPWPTDPIGGTALIVHSPTVGERHRHLPRLIGAKDEAQLVRAALPGSVELSGESATPAAVREEAGGHGLLHFAVHGEIDGNAPGAAHLILSGEGGLLQVVDVLALDLHEDMPVVLLSACEVGGMGGDGGGSTGLPWAFLEAGASAVIATRERLDDRAAVDFSRAFYEAVAEGLPAQAAFERGLQSLREKWPPGVAASFSFWI